MTQLPERGDEPQAAVERARLLDTVLANAPDLSFAFANDGRVLYANRALDTGGEPWPTEKQRREIAQVAATGAPVTGLLQERAHGSTQTFEYHLHAVRDVDGNVPYVVGTARDVTDRQSMQRDLDRSKDEFLATLAHELRGPLAPLRNALHVLRLSPDAKTSAQLQRMMERQVEHLVRLVEDLLEVSRISRGQIELRFGRVELSDVIAASLETSRPIIEASRHTLTVDLPDGPVVLYADQERLAQVFSNLLVNAAKYTPAGGHIRLSATREGDSLRVSVRDDGIGMDRERIEHAFALFTQLEEGTSRAQGGLGIGLYLVRTLTTMHGGTVHAHSEGNGQGSEFVVQLPLPSLAAPGDLPRARATGHERAAAAPVPPERPSGDVLVVDDNVDAAESLAVLLRMTGFRTRVARSGAAALDAIAQSRPSAVLLDIGMPGMNGFEVAERIRQQPAMRGVPIIALTGWDQEEIRRRALEAGFDHHLVKPVDPNVLGALLANAE